MSLSAVWRLGSSIPTDIIVLQAPREPNVNCQDFGAVRSVE